MIQITHFSHKEIFGKNDYYFLFTFWVLSCYLIFQKDYYSRSGYWRLKHLGKFGSKLLISLEKRFSWKIDYYHFCQFWPKLGPNHPFSRKQIIWKSWLLLLSTYYFLSRYNISKKSSEIKSWDRRLHNFSPNWDRVTSPKGNFLEKYANIALM